MQPPVLLLLLLQLGLLLPGMLRWAELQPAPCLYCIAMVGLLWAVAACPCIISLPHSSCARRVCRSSPRLSPVLPPHPRLPQTLPILAALGVVTAVFGRITLQGAAAAAAAKPPQKQE